MNLRPCALLCITLVCSLLPALAAEKGKQESVSATLKCGKQKWNLSPNVLGIFPVVITQKNLPVEIEIRYPQASEGSLVVIAARDGGNLIALAPGDGKGKGKGGGQTVTGATVRTRVPDNRKVEFTFSYGAEFHHQRITVDIGGDRKTFEFHYHP